MTVAVCYKCGEFKCGALTPCRKCRAVPKGDADAFELSMAMTDWHFDKRSLEKMSADIKRGKPPQLKRNPWWKFW